MRRTLTGLERRTSALDTAAAPGGLVLPAGMEQRVIPAGRLEQRLADDEDGSFEGWALLWNTTDSYGTRFRAGAFASTLDSDPYAFLWMHDPWTVLGTFTAEERDRGVWIEGRYDDTPEGQAARTRARTGSAPELSIGFYRTAVNPDDESEITEAVLVETSQITARMASVPGARITDARAAAAAADAVARRARVARARLLLDAARRG